MTLCSSCTTWTAGTRSRGLGEEGVRSTLYFLLTLLPGSGPRRLWEEGFLLAAVVGPWAWAGSNDRPVERSNITVTETHFVVAND